MRKSSDLTEENSAVSITQLISGMHWPNKNIARQNTRGYSYLIETSSMETRQPIDTVALSAAQFIQAE